jgi:hypothetical protein
MGSDLFLPKVEIAENGSAEAVERVRLDLATWVAAWSVCMHGWRRRGAAVAVWGRGDWGDDEDRRFSCGPRVESGPSGAVVAVAGFGVVEDFGVDGGGPPLQTIF